MTEYAFQKSQRLLTAEQYSQVFKANTSRASTKEMTLLVKTNEFGFARLGLAVAKKSAKSAVQRNRVKRLAREYFRLHQQLIGNVDCVILTRKGISSLENEQINQQLAYLFKKAVYKNKHGQKTAE